MTLTRTQKRRRPCCSTSPGRVDRHKKQDKKAKREVQDQGYVAVAWLTGCLGKFCSECEDAPIYERGTSERGTSNLTVQRIDNTVEHELDNLVPTCLTSSNPPFVRG